MAEGLAGAGARVLLVGRNEEKAAARMESITAAGGKADFVKADVSTKASLEKLLSDAVALAGLGLTATARAAEDSPVLLTVVGEIVETNRGPFDAFTDSMIGLYAEPFEKAYSFTLADLRALFEFMLPGYLGKPLAVGTSREDRELHNARLLQRAAPYILRRTKQAVAPELPEKIEQVVYCNMSESQRAFYEEVAATARRELFEMEMARAGEGRLRLAAFKELLRLRQACIDPRLIRPEAEIESAKLEAFREILEEALDGNHRILVFSQFTRALALLREELESRQVPHLYLDGSTRNRTALCQQFNDDARIPVFLISLKAGGVGLNLTGADTVIHYDPWWNPAVENQATDRAHRIGQTRHVFNYKLITRGTVEEKILGLQRKKKELAELVIGGDESVAKELTQEDLEFLFSF